jgi:hypothetical protein
MPNKISLEVVNFKQELNRIQNEVNNLANINIHKRIDYATNQLAIVTPVDTGEARRGWKNEKITFSKNSALSGIIKNDVDYIEQLNKGSSKQAPKYFIEQVLSTIGILTPN